MRVLFIYPNIDCPAGINHGLVCMSGVLKQAGHDVKLLHVNDGLWAVPTEEEVLRIARDYDPGIIGFSVMTQQYLWSKKNAEHLKANWPGGACPPIVIGGVHCTMVPEEVIQDRVWDYVGLGECDYTFLDLCRRLEKGEDPTTTPNFWMWRGERLIKNPVAPFPDLADMPLDYELFDMTTNLKGKNGWLGILTSRGCPYKCTYCFNKEIVDLYKEDGAIQKEKEFLRTFPIDRVLADIRRLKQKHPGITTLILDDDLFTINKRYAIDFARAYKESGIELPFVINAHPNCFDEELAFHLSEAGCIIVKFGLESGSLRVRRDILWRKMSNQQIKDSFAAAHRYGLHTSAFIMFGLPTETREEVFETFKICAEIELGRFRWAIFFPFPGTMGYTITNNLGLIDFEKMNGMGNYFDASCLKFNPAHDLFLEKAGRMCHWWVNSLMESESAPIYKAMADEVDSWDRETWEKRRKEIKAWDRRVSEEMLEKNVRHYSLRYTHVMGVHSDFVKKDRQPQKNKADWALPVGYTLD